MKIHRGAIPDSLRLDALRRLHLLIRDWWNPTEYEACLRSTFFPAARFSPEFLALQEFISAIVDAQEGETWCEPQLLIRFPDDCPDWGWHPHVDQEPPWADGRRYRTLIGAMLTPSRLAIEDQLGPRIVILEAGDLIELEPSALHQSVPNRTAAIRFTIWYRLLGIGVLTDH